MNVQGTKTLTSQDNILGALEVWWKSKLVTINTLLPVRILNYNSSKKQVDVEILISSIDANGEIQTPVQLFNCQFLTITSGNSGINIPPNIGDIGLMGFCQRDLTKVLETKNYSSPDSFRMFSKSDGIYLFTLISSNLENKIDFENNKITIENSTSVEIDTKDLSITSSDLLINSTKGEISGTTIDINSSTLLNLEAGGNSIGSILKDLLTSFVTNAPAFAPPPSGALNPAIVTSITLALQKLAAFK